jgi:NAD(P) transhydrogenase subunit alpha
MTDKALQEAGATIADGVEATLKGADLVLKVARPMSADEGTDEMALLPDGAMLIGLLAPLQHTDQVGAYAGKNITAFAMELVPRISRAQSMDALSSQSNLAGYKAVLDAAGNFGKVMPMMMTAAGTIAPAKCLVLGAGVAGLQAIATAKRLGAVVSAFDVRPVVKEQVESLGAKFVEVESEDAADAETAGGYAKEMSEDYKRRQSELIHETLKSQDIAICTALIPGRPAPTLITAAMVKDMKPGSVIVDLATETGGNCELSEHGMVVEKHGVTIVGYANVPGRVAVDASALYARNLLNFLTPMIDAETKSLKIDWDDEVIAGACVTRDGKVVHPLLTEGAGR